MIEVLHSGVIGDEVNDNAEQDFAGKFGAAESVTFIFFAHQGDNSPSTAGVKCDIWTRDDPDEYAPVPNAVLTFSGPGASAAHTAIIDRGDLKSLGSIRLSSTGTGDAHGAGIVIAVW